jgi:GDP-4-dehydro-6-deoxy-D-mannose reductase
VRRFVNRVRPALVFHLAGTTKPVGWELMWQAHVEATMNLLGALEGTGCRVWVSGSAAEYGETGARPVREDGAAWPETVYGSTKLAQTLAALAFRHRGLSVAVARVFNLMGPGTPENLSLGSFSRQIADIERGAQPAKIFVGNLEPRRDYIDVRDAASGLLTLAEKGEPGRIYNLASGRMASMSELLRRLLALSSKKIEVIPEASRMRPIDVRHCCGDPARARRLGWRPAFTLDESLRATLETYRGR